MVLEYHSREYFLLPQRLNLTSSFRHWIPYTSKKGQTTQLKKQRYSLQIVDTMQSGYEPSFGNVVLHHIFPKEENLVKQKNLRTITVLNHTTKHDGLLSVRFPGLTTSEDWLPDGKDMFQPTKDSFISPVLCSASIGF